MDISYILSPITSVRRRNNTIAFAFVRPLYNKIVGFLHGVFHVVSIRSLAFTYHYYCYFKSAYFAIKVVTCF